MTIFELLKDSNPKEYEKISKIIGNSEKKKRTTQKNQMKFVIAAHKAITTFYNEFDVCNLSKRNVI
jgi:hypothetical protein